MNIQAWYPAEAVTAKDISDQSQGFADFDYLKAETTAKFSATGAVSLSFVHQMAKVTCTLEAGNNITDISHATVSFYGYTTASFSKGDVTAGSDSSNGWITPTTDKEALVVPQDMKGQKFIRVTISGREYFYTPGENDANLEAGKQYNYAIKVNETGLEVTVDSSVSWTDGSNVETGDGKEATAFNVYLAAFTAPTNTSDYKVTDADGNSLTASDGVYSNISSDGISISLSAAESYRLKTFLTKVNGGICKQRVSYTAASRTYTYTFYDIRSDLQLSDIQVETEDASTILPDPQVGDYYYADGTWASTLEKPCIGIVFKVGAAGSDQPLNYDQLNAIRGYAVALTDAVSSECSWGNRSQNTALADISSSDNADYNGYQNTKTIINGYQNTDTWDDYAAFGAIVSYRSRVSAPANSSDWYLPSLKQLADVWEVYKNAQGNTLYDRLNSLSSDNLFKEAAIGQNNTRGGYWTSTERKTDDAWYVRFTDGQKTAYSKGQQYVRNCFVRAILTF